MSFILRVLCWVCIASSAVAQSELVAEDQTPSGKFLTATEVKPILSATKPNWIGVREWDGKDLVYVTHLWAWRCGLLQMQIAINDGVAQIWPMPACHFDLAQPASILDTDGLPFAEFPLQSVQSVSVKLIYDDLSEETARFERSDVKIP